MFRKFVWLFVILPAGAVFVTFAVANRHTVRLNLDPFAPEDPFLAIDAPFFLFLIAALAAGVLLGGLATWLGQGKWRKSARRNAREATALRRQSERLNEQLLAANRPRLENQEAAE